MKCFFCPYLEATELKCCVNGHLYCLFGVMLLSKFNITPRITTAPSETQINQHEERPFEGFFSNKRMTLASRKTYIKLSSNGLDLAELASYCGFAN
jgi:hypothetical protein